jgi:diguanylate cyclase
MSSSAYAAILRRPLPATADPPVWRRWLLALLLCVVGWPALAADAQIELWHHQDPSDSLDIESVRRLPQEAWQRAADSSVALGYASAPVWFKVRLRNPRGEADALLEIAYPMLQEIEMFNVGGDGGPPLVLGAKWPFDMRPVAHRKFLVPLHLAAAEVREIHVRVRTQSSVQFGLKLHDPTKFHADEQGRLMVQGSYLGVVIAILLYNFYLLVALRERLYLWYLGWIVGMAGFVMTMEGFTFQWLWPAMPGLTLPALPILVAFIIGFGGLFQSDFIALDRHWPAAGRIQHRLVLAMWAAAAGGLFLPYIAAVVIAIVVAVVAMSAFLYISLVMAWRGTPMARLFVTSFAPVIGGGLLLAGSKFGILQASDFTEHGPQIGSAVEMLLLAVAIGLRLHSERALREAAQQDVIERQRRFAADLELRVEERTAELARANALLAELSATDPLTVLANRRQLERTLEAFLERCRENGRHFGVLMVDIDRFKVLNDSHGHAVGDACLRAVADRLRASVRGDQDVVLRYGGEEFCIATTADDAAAVAERARRRICEQEVEAGELRLNMSVSIGVATAAPSGRAAFDAALRRADAAMYRAKQGGRNRCVLSGSADAPAIAMC